MNKCGETVKCNFDLNTAYDVLLIEKLKVFNLSTKEWNYCEVWGENVNRDADFDFGSIADFNFDISKTYTRLYYPESLYYGYYKSDQSKLIILPLAATIPEEFIDLGYIKLEEYYPAPKTMMDLANQIDNFLYLRTKRKLELQNEHKQAYQAMIKLLELPAEKNNENDDLPF